MTGRRNEPVDRGATSWPASMLRAAGRSRKVPRGGPHGRPWRGPAGGSTAPRGHPMERFASPSTAPRRPPSWPEGGLAERHRTEGQLARQCDLDHKSAAVALWALGATARRQRPSQASMRPATLKMVPTLRLRGQSPYGFPAPAITMNSMLSGRVTLIDNHNGTASLGGTPDPNAMGQSPTNGWWVRAGGDGGSWPRRVADRTHGRFGLALQWCFSTITPSPQVRLPHATKVHPECERVGHLGRL